MTSRISIKILAISVIVSISIVAYLKKTSDVGGFDEENVKSLLKSTMSSEYISKRVKESLDNEDPELAKQYISLAKSLSLEFDKNLSKDIESEEEFFNSIYRDGKNFTEGFVSGTSDSSASLAGSIASDFTIVGDIRDLSSETINYINNKPVNKIVAGLSAVGIALTTGTVLSVGGVSGATIPGKVSASLLKASVKTGKLSTKLIKHLSKLINDSINLNPILAKIKEIKGFDNLKSEKWESVHKVSKENIKLNNIQKTLNNISSINKYGGGINNSLSIIKYADNSKDIKELVKLTKSFGNKSVAVLKILGKKSLKFIKFSIKKLTAIWASITAFTYLVIHLLASLLIKKGIFNSSPKMKHSTTLRDAYKNKKAPTSSGVYEIRLDGKLMKVGKASDGLRKRFSDYYRGKVGGTAGLKYITEDNRDNISVVWRICKKDVCRDHEIKLYEQAIKSGEDMPWSERK